MSLAAGPGRGRVVGGQLPDDLKLVVDRHVAYVQKLDTVRFLPSTGLNGLGLTP
jgi:geranylgeranyl transferase type-2 subunit beta